MKTNLNLNNNEELEDGFLKGQQLMQKLQNFIDAVGLMGRMEDEVMDLLRECWMHMCKQAAEIERLKSTSRCPQTIYNIENNFNAPVGSNVGAVDKE